MPHVQTLKNFKRLNFFVVFIIIAFCTCMRIGLKLNSCKMKGVGEKEYS